MRREKRPRRVGLWARPTGSLKKAGPWMAPGVGIGFGHLRGGGPLLRAQMGVTDLAGRLRANRAALDEIARRAIEEHRMAARVAELDCQRATIEGLAAWHLKKEIDDLLDRLGALDREIQEA